MAMTVVFTPIVSSAFETSRCCVTTPMLPTSDDGDATNSCACDPTQ
jgi:hypothetical protein